MSEKTTDTSRPEDPVCTQPWEAFRSRNKLQPRYDWHQAKIPVELQTVPDDNEAPEKLKQIIAWSLLQVHPPSTPITQDKAEENIDKSGTTICDVGDITTIGQSLLPEPTKDEDVADSHSVSPAPTVEKPSGPRKRRPNAHHYNISQGLFASTLDLITTFKPKAENHNQAQGSTNREPHAECVSCFDEFPIIETPTLPCTHSYCKTCLKELVLTALRTESSFPPKCCLTEIPLQTVLLPLDKKQREAYKEKAAEYAVPAEERWYCPNTKCLKWIPPRKASRFMNSSQRCSHCSTRICVICRGISHRRLEECPQDYGLEATLSLAEMEGWRRCFKCRALVERTEGCRHMACRCGSQFCYYCGSKWKTCKCTDFEGTQRIAERRRQREVRDAVAAAEAEEIARAIAEVEAMERREAEEREREAERLRAERHQEEERLRAERLKEEEELRRLEQLRLQEEERKRLEKEEEEKEYRRVLRISVTERIEALQSAFGELTRSQQQALDQKHLLAEQAQSRAHEEDATRQRKEDEGLIAKMEANIKRRTSCIGEKQKSELTAFEKEQEQAEDDMFLQIQLHLQGKPNKELREQRLRDELTKQRDQKLEAINKRFGSEFEALNQNAAMEMNILKWTSERRLQEIETRYDHELRTLVATVTTDRAWFDYLVERRQNMLSANSRLMLEAVDSDQEVVGLTEDVAMTIGPFAVAEPSPASSVTESPSNSFIELATDCQRLLKNLAPGDDLGAGGREEGANQVSKNQAWDFMTLGGAPTSANSTPSWTTARSQQWSSLDRQLFPTPSYAAYRGDFTMSGALSPLDERSAMAYHRQSRRLNDAPPVPSIPTLYLPEGQEARSVDPPSVAQNQTAEAGEEMLSPQPSIEASAHEDHKFIVIPSLHSRQSSSDSSGNMTNSSSTSMSSLDSGLAASTHQRKSSGSLKPEIKQQGRRLWSFRSLTGRGADGYTEEEIRERMKRAVGDALGA